MKYDDDGKKMLHLVQARSDRTLSEIAGMLRVDLQDLDEASAITLSEKVAEQMRAMPPEDLQATLLTSALALADVKELCLTLNGHLEEVGGEINRLKSHNVAASAYRRGRAAIARPR